MFQPSVSDIDVSHRGLQGVRMEGRSEREEIFVGRSHTHLLITPHTQSGGTYRDPGSYLDAGLQSILVGGERRK